MRRSGEGLLRSGDIHEQRENDHKYSQEELTRMGLALRLLWSAPAPTRHRHDERPRLRRRGDPRFILDMRIGCEHASFRFLAAAYGRINSTWTLPNQVGWPMAKELLFSARKVEAEEAHRIGLLNHLVPCARCAPRRWNRHRDRQNDRKSVIAIKALLLRDLGCSRSSSGATEFTRYVMPGPAEDAFEFIKRKDLGLGAGRGRVEETAVRSSALPDGVSRRPSRRWPPGPRSPRTASRHRRRGG
jgi:hypothetical protein